MTSTRSQSPDRETAHFTAPPSGLRAPAALLAASLLLALLPAAPLAAQDELPETILLSGTVRDFQRSHPDFEYRIGNDRGMVDETIGPDRKPYYVLDPPATTFTTTGRDNFDQWYRDVEGVNRTAELTITLDRVQEAPLLYRFDDSSFFPIDGQLWGNEGLGHNYWFTYEIHTAFTYQGGETFTFRGDDDVWVFINDHRVIDLGGVHSAQTQSVDLDAAAGTLGLTVGETYLLDLFFAERHTSQSSFRIETSIVFEEPEPEPEPEPGGILPPIADAGPDQTVPEGSLVTLDASGSEDPSRLGLVPSAEGGNLPGGTALEAVLSSLGPAAGGVQPLYGSASIGEGPPVVDTAIVYVLDLSGSANFAGGCGGDQNNDGLSNRILDCEIAATLELHQQVLASGTVAAVGLVTFSSGAQARDLDPGPATALLIAPDADADDNGVNDLEQTLRTLRAGGATNFAAAVSRACTTIAGSTAGTRVGVFLSDGQATRGGPVTGLLPCDPPVTFETFAIGASSSCTAGAADATLQVIADRSGGGCTAVPDVGNLPDILPEVIGSRIIRLTLSIDGGAEIDVSDTTDPPLPVDGPGSLDFNVPLPELGPGEHEICLTVTGTDAGGEDSVTTCSQVVTAEAPLTYLWQLIDGDGPPIVLSSASAEMPTFLAPDDGQYTFELTVTSGFGLTDSDRVVVTVENVAPGVAAESSEAYAGGVTLVTASFTDVGWLDTHEATTDWGDGSAAEPVPVTVQGSGWGTFFGSHIYGQAGTYTVTVTLTDDDGGTSTDVIGTLEVQTAAAVWANSETAPKTLDWSGGSGRIEGRVHSNNELRVVGQTKTVIGPSTYAGTLTADTRRHVFDPLPVMAPVEDFPLRFELADYRPGGMVSVQVGAAYHDMSGECQGGKWHAVNTVLPSGVYYAACDVELNGSAVGGRITLAAEGSIRVSGSRPAFEPYYDGLLFLAGAAGSKAIDLAASNSKFLGVLFAEHGEIDVSGDDNRFYCGILGDLVDLAGSGLWVRGASCGRPASTVADPLLVPELGLELAADPADVFPGEGIDYQLTLANGGSLLVVPGVLGLENVDLEPATVRAYAYVLEYFDLAAGAWTPFASAAAAEAGYTPAEPLPTLGGIDFVPRANPSPGVTYPAAGDPILGTVIEADGFATWGYQAVVDLAPEEVDLLLDAARVGGVRHRVELELEPADVQVRRLFRFGTDFVEPLRALSGDVAEVELTMTRPTGDPLLLDAASDPRLSALAPGDEVAISDVYEVAVAAPRGTSETDAAYVERLLAADGAPLFASAFARAQGGVGLLVAPLVYASSAERLPVLAPSKSGPAAAVSGQTLGYDVSVANRGSASALAVAVADELEGDPLTLSPPLPAEIFPGHIEAASASYPVPAGDPGGDLTNRVEATWSDAAGNLYGPSGASVTTTVATPPALSASLADSVFVDADGNGLTSPGDTLQYEAVLANSGGTGLAGVLFALEVDPASALVPGSVSTSAGTVTGGNDPGDTVVTVDVGTLAGGTSASIFFRVTIADPFPETANRLSVQALVASDELADVLSDDPSLPGVADPTVTYVVVPVPFLTATLGAALVVDSNGDGHPGPGDTLRYTADLANEGGATATGVELTLPPDPETTLVAGSVTTTAGTVVEGQDPGDDMVRVDLGSLAPGAGAVVTFEAAIDVFVSSASVSVQGWATSDQLAPVVTDDPATAAEADPTVVVLTFEGGGGPGGGPGGLPGPQAGDVTPAEGTAVTEPVTVSTTLTPPEGETVVGWTVSYRLEGDGQLVEIASGTGPDVAAIFDPTVVPNGNYVLVIAAEASGGGVSFTESSVVVEGDLKLGRYTTTFRDLSLEVGALALQVLRTYDSIDKSVGDFGVGWSLDIADFRVRSNGPLGQGGWRQEVVSGGLIFSVLGFFTDVPHFVTVTWPNGFVETFDLTPANGSTFFPLLTAAEFTGRPGTTSELEALDTSLFFPGDGNLYGGAFGTGGIYDPRRFRLTDRYGTEYVIDRDLGLQSIRDRNGNTVTITADGIVSSSGPDIAFLRDAQGRITSIFDPAGGEIVYTYDGAGDLVRVTDQNLAFAELTYAGNHYLTDVSGVLGTPLLTAAYGADGRLESITDGSGNAVELAPDVGARSEVVTGPDPRLITVYTYGERGDVEQVDRIFDGRTLTYLFEHDDRGRITRSTDPLGNFSTAVYGAKGDLERLVDVDGTVFEITYNDFGQPLTMTVDGSLLGSYEYGPTGNVDAQRLADGSATTFTYDGAGRVTAVTDRGSRTLTVDYDGAGFISRLTSPQGVTEYTNNASGQPTRVIDPLGGETLYAYDAVGNLTSFTDPESHTWAYDYDEFDRLTVERDPLGRERTYTYDAAGRLETVTDRTGVVTTLTYNPDGQVASRSASDGSFVDYVYDPLGRLVEVANAVARISYTWDDASFLSEERVEAVGGSGIPTVTFGRTSTPAGLPQTLTDPFGTTTFAYASQRLVSVTDSQLGAFGFSYDPIGRLTALSRPNAVTDVYAYLGDRLASRTSVRGALTVDAVGYEYGPTGSPSAIDDDDGRHEFTYDARDRIESAAHPAPSGLPAETYAYDGAGNRSSWAGNPAADVAHDAANRLLSDGSYTYGYDAEGRLTSRTERSTGAVTTFEWNAFDRLARVSSPAGIITYSYDPLGRRIATVAGGQASYRFYDGANLRLVLNDDGSLRTRYVNGLGLGGVLGIADGGTLRYPIADLTATITALTDPAGAVAERFRYDGFGNPASPPATPSTARWHGLDRDDAGLYNTWARAYDPATGRFLSEDPIPAANLYVYAFNNPVVFSDPTGLAALVEYSSTNEESSESAPALCAEGSAIAGVFADLATDLLFTEVLSVVTHTPGLYAFTNGSTGQTYVGRSVDLRRRILEHLRTPNKVRPGSNFKILELSEEALDHLDVAEQLAIRDCGGVDNLANVRNAVNKKRRDQIEELYETLNDLLRRGI